jgi:hypothetical protein
MFKDHLVEWVTEYLESIHGKTHAKVILADIDQRCVISLPFKLQPDTHRSPSSALPLRPCFQVCNTSLRVVVSNSGRAMTQRL